MRINKKMNGEAAYNLGLAQAGHCLFGKCLQNSKLCSSWQVCISPAYAKPYSVTCKRGNCVQKKQAL